MHRLGHYSWIDGKSQWPNTTSLAKCSVRCLSSSILPLGRGRRERVRLTLRAVYELVDDLGREIRRAVFREAFWECCVRVPGYACVGTASSQRYL